MHPSGPLGRSLMETDSTRGEALEWGETDDPVEVSPRLGTEYHSLLKIHLRRVY
jgi:hypothetical protein